jgi:hypothetical protein
MSQVIFMAYTNNVVQEQKPAYRLSYKREVPFSAFRRERITKDGSLGEIIEMLGPFFSTWSNNRYVKLTDVRLGSDGIVLTFNYHPAIGPYKADGQNYTAPQGYKARVKVEPTSGTLFELDTSVKNLVEQKTNA